MEKVAIDSITLTKAAYADAAKELSGEKPWWKFWLKRRVRLVLYGKERARAASARSIELGRPPPPG